MRIVLTGGGTGGHIVPFEPIIEALRVLFQEKKDSLPGYLEPSHLHIQFVGVVTPAAKKLFDRYSVESIHIPSGKLRRYASGKNIVDLLIWLPIGIIRAIVQMWVIMPDVVISKGGYGSLPVVLAAALYRIPVLLHESDLVPGKTNSWLTRFATAITVAYPDSRRHLKKNAHKVYVTGTPVRGEIRRLSQSEGKQQMGFPNEEFVLLVMGGSQGAKQINEALLASLPQLITEMGIIHITGEEHLPAVETVADELLAHSPRKNLYKPFGYLDEKMAAALVGCDAVVSRAGSTLAEIAAARKPSLLIPLDGAANDHQRKNAQLFEEVGAALVLDPKNMGRHLFRQNVLRLRTDDHLRQVIVENLTKIDTPQAARDIAQLGFYLAQGLYPKPKK